MPTSPPEPLRVLVVEDDCLVALDLGQMLEELGCRVVGHVTDADAATGALPACDIALLDVDLHGRPSDRLRQALLARGVRIVLVTGYAPSDLPGDTGACALLQKPVQHAQLRAVLARLRDPSGG